MTIVPAPLRQFKTYTMWLGIAIGSFDAAVALVEVFGTTEVLTHTAVIIINAVLGFLIVPAKLIAQDVPVTLAEQSQLVQQIVSQTVKPDPAPPAPPTPPAGRPQP